MEIPLYIVILAAIFFRVTALPAVVINALLKPKWYHEIMLGTFVGGIISWMIYDFIWRLVCGEHIPMLVLSIAMLWIFAHYMLEYERLNEGARLLGPAEFFGILAYGLYLLIFGTQVNWLCIHTGLQSS